MTRKERKEATKARLIEVAREAFQRDGYDAVTFRGLASTAGVSTGAFFSSWTDKKALYEAAMGFAAPDPIQFAERVATVCAGLPGEAGELSKEAMFMRAQLVGGG